MTPQPSNSFKQFDYSLRPSKQVERKIMVEVLLRLGGVGFDISDYKYLGFGSPYYVDFVMFHKYLFIRKMICVEWGDVARRMRFNKPFKFIRLKLGPLSKHIPAIRQTEKFFIWLDYDRSLDQTMLLDIDGVAGRLAPGSIFVVTVDARPKLPKDFESEDLPVKQRELQTLRTYKEWFSSYLERQPTGESVSRAHVANTFYEVITERIRQTLVQTGSGLRFFQVFNYFYQDGAPMLTLGGIIGTEADESRVQGFSHRFVRTGKDYLTISVPPLTLREKQWIDRRLDDELTTKKLSFELDDDPLKNYIKFYKEYPTYLETLL
ncbi:MAG TPA: O-methyltransferase [Bryobacteraceae bacterium]|nr:O-methyltransferase [Bryobacteraceae bacterium]